MLDREAVGVGRDHRQLIALGLDEDAGQDRSHLVARGGAGHALDGRLERCGRKRRGVPLDVGKTGEVLGGQRAEVKARIAGGELDVALLRALLDRHVAGGQAAGDVGEEPARQKHLSLALDLSVGEGERDPHLHVGRAELEALGRRVEENAAERRQRRAGGDGTAGMAEGGNEGFAGGGELHEFFRLGIQHNFQSHSF